MKATNPRRWRCGYCSFLHIRKQRTADHELHCWKRPERLPWPGEITSVRRTGKIRDWGPDDYLPGGMNWFEWSEVALPAWWPGEGKIWTGEAWEGVPFYESAEVTGAHGCAGGAGPEDHWPLVVEASALWSSDDLFALRDYVEGKGAAALPAGCQLTPLDQIKPASRRLGVLGRLVPWQPPAKKPRPAFEWRTWPAGWWLSPGARQALGGNP